MRDVTEFRITYDGPALESSEMDVNELAPALLAMGRLIEAATRVIHGDRVKPQVNVRGSFKTGSFSVDFALATDLLQQVRDFLRSSDATAVSNGLTILQYLGLATAAGATGLFAVLKRIRGRPVARIETQGRSAILHVDGERIEVEPEVLALLRDMAVRDAIDHVLQPLSDPGIDTFAAGTDKRFDVIVTADERDWFRAPTPDDALLLDEVRKMAFSIVTLTFKDGNKWRLYDGNATINAVISDLEFRRRVNANLVHFTKSDVLICNVRVRQWQTSSGAKTEYEILEVLEHRHGMEQIPMDGI